MADDNTPPPHSDADAVAPDNVTPLRRPPKPPVRVPPHDLDAEAGLLGACMLRGDAVEAGIAAGVSATDFYRPAHAQVWSAIRQLWEQGDPVDVVTVKDVLARDGLLDGVGGASVLVQLVSDTPAISNAAKYASIVVDLAQLRALNHVAGQISDLAYALPDDIAATVAKATELVRVVSERRAPGHDAGYTDVLDLVGEEDDDYEWVIDGLVEAGDRTIITATPGTGKSTLLRQVGVMAAAGMNPFTVEVIDPVRVLLLDVENSRRQSRRALDPVVHAAGSLLEPGMFEIKIFGGAIDIADPAVELDIAKRVEAFQPGIILCGPLYKLIAGDPTAEEPARRVADAFDRLRGICGSALMIEAHTPYAGGGKKRETRPYGASLWERWPEFGWYFNEAGDIEHWRGQREQRSWPVALQRSTPWPWVQRIASPVNRADAGEAWEGPTRCMEAIVLLLSSADRPMSARALSDALRASDLSFRDATVREAAERAAMQGLIRVTNGPRRARLFQRLADAPDTLGEF